MELSSGLFLIAQIILFCITGYLYIVIKEKVKDADVNFKACANIFMASEELKTDIETTAHKQKIFFIKLKERYTIHLFKAIQQYKNDYKEKKRVLSYRTNRKRK